MMSAVMTGRVKMASAGQIVSQVPTSCHHFNLDFLRFFSFLFLNSNYLLK